MAKKHKLRDPIHNFIHLRDKEMALIDTPVFQRLRGIRQLALANLAFPGALHTRFDHSIGVCHVAGLMAEELGFEGDDLELVRLAALEHDLGHGPFSHVSETSLKRFTDPAKLKAGQKKEKIHELITAQIIQRDKDIQRILAPVDRDKVTKLLSVGYGDPALKSIISGPLDADKQDYLLRDSYFAGVSYGKFDLHQLHRSLKLGGDGIGQELRIAAEGVAAVEQFVMAKYYMTANVYRHKVRLITDQMISRAIALGIEVDHIEELNTLFRYDASEAFIANYVRWDDARFLQEFSSSRYEGKLCHNIVSRVVTRQLFKRVFREQFNKLPEAARELASKAMEAQTARTTLETLIAEAINETVPDRVDPRFVIANLVSVKLGLESAKDEGKGVVVDTGSEVRTFESVSALFDTLQVGFDVKHLEVYAPITWDNPVEKNRTLADLAKAIMKRLETPMKPKKKGK